MDVAHLSIRPNKLIVDPRWLPRLHIFFPVAACLGFPALLLLTAAVTLQQAGSLDPFVYAGYVHDYGGTLTRFGQTYYSTRVAYIYPEHLFYSLFGLERGYYALRFILLASASAAVYAIARRFYSNATAILIGWMVVPHTLVRAVFVLDPL